MHTLAYEERLRKADATVNGEYPPDSKYWFANLRAAARILRDAIGDEAFEQFVDEAPDNLTWHDWYNLFTAKFKELG